MQEQFVPKPDNNMALAIFTTVCCCLPLGIVAIIKASKVNTYYVLKQYDLAHMEAEEAKKYAYIGIAVGLVCQVIGFITNFATLMSH